MATIQTEVLVNGQWTTQHVTLDEILANERQQAEAAATSKQQRLPDPLPHLGLLSRTVLRSPIVNWIFPARVRHKRFNDVVFIGEDFVHIKEIGPDGHLRHIASKTDFDSRIRAARCFGEPRKPAEDGQLKTEDADDLNNDTPDAIPPQVILLTLESQKLVFLFARQDERGHVNFIQSTNRLSSGMSSLERPGKHLAVDPRSRAIAIAACQETVIIYTTKSMAAWRENIAASPHPASLVQSTPRVEERAFRIENGVILKMEFLSPSPDDTDSIVLLVIFSVFGKTKMSCYEWDANSTIRGPQSAVTTRVERYPLENDESHPLFVIPLQKSPSFLLVGERNISRYHDILTGSPRRTNGPIPNEKPRCSGSSQRRPLYTNWARTVRNWEAQGKQVENFYMVREDGVVLYGAMIGDSHPSLRTAGQFQCSVDSAFASLDFGESLTTPDVLIAAGDMSYGEVIKIGSWPGLHQSSWSRAKTLEFEYIESLPNWAPVMDASVSRRPGVSSRYERTRDSIFTTSGRARYGSITELRHGINARVCAKAELAGRSGATGLWTLYDPTNEGFFFLVSHPWQSRLYHLSITSWAVSEATEEDCGMDLSKETLAAGSLGSEWTVQITRTALHILSISEQSQNFSCRTSMEFSSDRSVHAAAFDAGFPLVVLATRQGSAFSLELLRLVPPAGKDDVDDSPSVVFQRKIPLPDEPTCLQIVGIGDRTCAFVGTTAGGLILYEIVEASFSLLLVEQVEAQFMQDIPVVCESVALISSAEYKECTLVCGMRNGCLYSLNLEIDMEHPSQPISIASTIVTPMGQTSAKVIQCSSEPNAVFVLCGSDCCRLTRSFDGRDDSIRPELDSIWFTDHGTPGFQQSSISAMVQVPPWPDLENAIGAFSPGGCLLTVSDSAFSLAQLDNEAKAVPRRMLMEHTPYRMMYSNRLKMMVVAATKTKEKKGKKRHGKGFRSVRSIVQLIRLGDETSNAEPDDEDDTTDGVLRVEPFKTFVAGECELWPHEKVYALSEWHWEEGGKKYDFILVGTGVTDSDGVSGRLLYFQTNLDNFGVATFRVGKIRQVKSPVYALALYDERRLIYSCGTTIHVDEFSDTERKWHEISQYTLPSPGLQITVQGHNIYVSTAQDSVCAMGFGLSGSGQPVLRPLFSDSRTRDTLSHLAINLPPIKLDLDKQTASLSSFTSELPRTLILVSDKSCSLAGLLQPSQPTLSNAAPTLFEASLTRCVTRLRRGSIRPPWRRHYPKSFATSELRALQHDLSDPKDLPARPPVVGILADDILGTAVDGTLFAFSILDTPAWSMLKFLETLITAHYSAAPHTVTADRSPEITLNDLHPRIGVNDAQLKPTAFHVDGDLLVARIMRSASPTAALSDLLLCGVDKDVRATFAGLAFGALGGMEIPKDCEEGGYRVVRLVVEWMGEVLDAVL